MKSPINPDRSWLRARRALCCSPFTPKLCRAMAQAGVPLRSIVGQEGVTNQFLVKSLAIIPTEDNLSWLIQVGILRREVDGQGITDSFRLTPLGHRLMEDFTDRDEQFPRPTISDRVANFLLRWQPLKI